MSRKQRGLLAETLRDTANVAAGALVFGQSLGGSVFSRATATLGVAVWSSLVIVALWLNEES